MKPTYDELKRHLGHLITARVRTDVAELYCQTCRCVVLAVPVDGEDEDPDPSVTWVVDGGGVHGYAEIVLRGGMRKLLDDMSHVYGQATVIEALVDAVGDAAFRRMYEARYGRGQDDDSDCD